ncbi:pyrroline-5-carboxylate reductase [Pseudomonas sp. R5(2019)]|uniref:pyrroline-5-carboxylate reductase n=1 Tax=Pseudomonas sp. R5(2019) TaxID=2697566 RepID=UPI001412C30E|nr:pyrroline-5-carboxylate reductase [Pseudomonas sp. R5(2019)]NBA96559.1 pyrroline-5-carboxylate reductase [Pseudomonas sp. R5(2019)]
MNVLFLGYGKMGSALGEAWLSNGLVKRLVAVDPGRPQGVKAEVLGSAAELDETSAFDLIVVAVKPALAREAIVALPQPSLDGAIVVSIMAGVTCAELSAAAGLRAAVVRAMPNTPVMVNQGCTGLFSATLEDPARRKSLQTLFEAVGIAVWLEREAQLDAVTAISGSGPAYYHLFSEALADAGIALGLPAELARKLAAQTARGAAELQVQPQADFITLRQTVTSPNGTTAAAIAEFETEEKLRQLVKKAAQAARDRSIELSQPS